MGNYITNMFVSKHNAAKFQVFAIEAEKILDLMRNNKKFEQACVKIAHEEWIGRLELSFRFNPFMKVANKFLWQISQRATLIKIAKGQKTVLPYGGYIYEGLVERVFGKNQNSEGTR